MVAIDSDPLTVISAMRKPALVIKDGRIALDRIGGRDR